LEYNVLGEKEKMKDGYEFAEKFNSLTLYKREGYLLVLLKLV